MIRMQTNRPTHLLTYGTTCVTDFRSGHTDTGQSTRTEAAAAEATAAAHAESSGSGRLMTCKVRLLEPNT